jgi:hypothetical protein
MNAEQINAVGGWCELVGVAFLVRDLMSLARYRDKPKEWASRLHRWVARVKAWWAATRMVAWWRRLRGRKPPATFAHAGVATGTATAYGVTAARGMRGPFRPQPGQSVEDQIRELGLLVNRLREEVIREPQEREQAIAAEREARRKELQAEAEERERGTAAIQDDVEKLRGVTTGDLGLRIESVVYLMLGVVLTTWPEPVADWLPEWPRFRVALVIVLGWPALRLWWQWRSRRDVAV